MMIDPNLRVEAIVRARPLGPPAPAWCDEHCASCALAQPFLLTLEHEGAETALATIDAKGHLE